MPGIFSRIARGINAVGGAAEKYFLKPGAETFVNPVGRALLTPVSTLKSEIEKAVPGGSKGQRPMASPFGDVKPMDINEARKPKDQRSKGVLTGGEAAMSAVELATSVPGAAEKLAVKGAQAVGKGLGPFAKPALNLTKKAGEAIVGSAERTFGQALAPTTKAAKAATEKITPQALKEGIVGTTGQIIKKARKGMEKAGQDIEDFGELVGTTGVKKLEDVFSKAKEQFRVNDVIVNKNAVAAIDEVADTVRQLADEAGEVPREALRAVRRIWDTEVAQAGGFLGKTLKEGSDIAIKKLGSDTIRNLLAEEVPNLKKLNANFNFYRNLLDVAEATKARRVGQSNFLRKGAGMITGAVLGKGTGVPFGEFAGAAAGEVLGNIGGSTFFKSLSAAAKNKLGQALVDGQHSLPKIADWISKATFPAVKVNDFYKFLDSEAKKSADEIEEEEAAHEARIEALQRSLFSDEEGAEEVPQEEREQRVSELRDFFAE